MQDFIISESKRIPLYKRIPDDIQLFIIWRYVNRTCIGYT
jgi:hypothetical protein